MLRDLKSYNFGIFRIVISSSFNFKNENLYEDFLWNFYYYMKTICKLYVVDSYK